MTLTGLVPLFGTMAHSSFRRMTTNWMRSRHCPCQTLIASACAKLSNGESYLSPREQAFYDRLLQDLPDVQDDTAAQKKIGGACRAAGQSVDAEIIEQLLLWHGGPRSNARVIHAVDNGNRLVQEAGATMSEAPQSVGRVMLWRGLQVERARGRERPGRGMW
ncbi:hypothetical protein AB4Y32_37790 [Paraburkholderia phymatum]|uniref:Uncharacterized protein n=1 Tax=Paraburkholderia phymatum TaxID=148447 RepID=A0ACC6UD93_9BURK